MTCVGTRDEVLALAGEEVPVFDIGSSVAYPGFIDAHAHWIGDRDYYGLDSAEEAMDAALRRGWTSISEQWVNPERLDELAALAAADALPLRVDGYLALNYGDEFFGDWYGSREPGPVDDRLRVQGIKFHLDDGAGEIINWDPADLTETIRRADGAGWQVSVHTVSTEAEDLVLDAFEAALGPTGPNPLHHRIDADVGAWSAPWRKTSRGGRSTPSSPDPLASCARLLAAVGLGRPQGGSGQGTCVAPSAS